MKCIVINNKDIPENEKVIIMDTLKLKLEELNSSADIDINENGIKVHGVNAEESEVILEVIELLIDMLPITRTLDFV